MICAWPHSLLLGGDPQIPACASSPFCHALRGSAHLRLARRLSLTGDRQIPAFALDLAPVLSTVLGLSLP
jgi:hypothetical protein